MTTEQLTSIRTWIASKTGTFTVAAAIGDSTVAAYLGHGSIISFVDATATNVAVPGDTIADQKAAWLLLSPAVKQAQLAVFIQVGLNDVDAVEAASVAIARLQDLVDTVRAGVSAGCKIYISQMTPAKQRWITTMGDANGEIAQQKWTAMNESIAGLGQTPITGVDGVITAHVALMGDGTGKLAASYDNGDGIHPNGSGRKINAAAWAAKLVEDGLIT